MSTIQAPRRGAIPSLRHALAAASPYAAIAGAPPNYIVIPQQISMWGNDVHGDCVTAEEAFAKACNNPEIFISDASVISWATRHNVLEGAYLSDVLTWMENDGFPDTSLVYDDGAHFSVNWADAAVLTSAIYEGPVKLGIAADQLETAWHSTGGHSGWFGTGWHADNNEDHCVALCGYGTISWLAQQLNVAVPSSVNGNQQGYAMFTWDSIGIIDVSSMIAVTQEAWIRRPTTVTKSTAAWSGWASEAGVLTSDIAVGRNADGRLEAFVRGTDNALWHKWQVTPNGGWSGWVSEGGVLTSDIAVGRNADGRMEVFVRGTDNALWHKWQTTPNGGWSGWVSEGGVLTSEIAVSRNLDGRMEVFVRGTDNAMWHKWQVTPNGGWSGWISEGGVLTSNIAVGQNADGRMEAFVRGTDNAMWHKWQTTPNGGWSGWISEGGILTSDIAIGRNNSGRLETFVRGTDNAMWHKWQTAPNSGWSGWASEGGVLTSRIAAASDADGRLEVFVRGTDQALWHKWQTHPM